ncbi:hypothetical protein [Corynebacterium flavescens]|uniref:hypothetical protein n=1 Tax=Corynebacterium flavescens TaxID=28028 RepID=UPI0026480189|nr:hypothetical protein [Corynebacterium flavescens]MDN6236035.1 hypothetical protein [Corynebacterium flavescens]MDN6430777.1 hypothetical protein [Corynebacterium flavescens]MDN6475226.1 hypothetical protein [Corynebacterium flavescens]MDN6601663.1 hypothetical protein [Corynebacterium flavescens]MDN6822664.1 hypothetical protein [Corynebacterium flavescens]
MAVHSVEEFRFIIELISIKPMNMTQARDFVVALSRTNEQSPVIYEALHTRCGHPCVIWFVVAHIDDESVAV